MTAVTERTTEGTVLVTHVDDTDKFDINSSVQLATISGRDGTTD